MNKRESRERERFCILQGLGAHPTLLIEGSNEMALRLATEAICETHTPTKGEKDLVLSNSHPDYHLYDGRDTNTDAARSLRDGVTAHPARWTFRYLLITYAERLHFNAASSLLKLIEEPPTKLRIGIITDQPSALLPTIVSRAFYYSIASPSKKEIENILREENVDEPVWRAEAGAEDLYVARNLDADLTREWYKLWAILSAGTPPPAEITYTWAERLSSANPATRVACWHLLVTAAAKKPANKFWREIAVMSMVERERSRRKSGGENWVKMTTTLTLVNAYAAAKAAYKLR